MPVHLKSVCMIASKVEERTWRLQPWRYITEVACQLAKLGHSVTFLSDGEDPFPIEISNYAVYTKRMPSVRNPVWKPNRVLFGEINQIKPDVVIWHVGLTSFLYQDIPQNLDVPVVGIFSNPVYLPKELAGLRFRKLLRSYKLSRVHLAGSLTPGWFIRALTTRDGMKSLIVQTQTTKLSLIQTRKWIKPIDVIPPGVDDCWLDGKFQVDLNIRNDWKFPREDIVLLYFGSPAAWRGIFTLIEALNTAHRRLPNLKLVILSRSRPDEWISEEEKINKLLHRYRLEPHVKMVSGLFKPEVLVSWVAAADIIVLPFEILPSDAPLSILEAMALGKPVITTRIACLPELVTHGKGYLAEPGDPRSLAESIVLAVSNHLNDKHLDPPNKFSRNWQTVGMEWSNYLQCL